MLIVVREFLARRVWYAWLLRVAICWFGIIVISSFTGSALFWFFPTDDPAAFKQLLGWFRAALVAGALISFVLIYHFVRLCFRFLDQRDPAELRMTVDRHLPLLLSGGMGVAIVMLAIVFGLQYLAGWIAVKSFSSPFDAYFLSSAYSSLIQFTSVGVGEEMRYRAYGYASGEGSIPRPILIVVCALLFAVLHAQYEQFGIIAVLNLMLIACFYMASLHLFNSIWFGVGFHFIWDFAQVSIFGLALAGTANESLIVIEQTGPKLWVGGTALIEAGLIYMVVFAAATASVMYLLYRRRLLSWRLGNQ